MSPQAPKELIELQEWFSQAVSAPDNERYLAESHRYITASAKQDTSERLDIYANDFWPRVTEVLEDDFPILLSVLGQPSFSQMVKQYIHTFPSKSFTLYYLGDRLANFIRAHFSHKKQDLLHDIAQYEWAKCRVFFAANIPPFTPRSMDADILSRTKLTLHPSVQQLNLSHVPSTFKNTTATQRSCHYVVFRKDFECHEDEISSSLMTLLEHLQQGGTLTDILAQMTTQYSSEILDDYVANIQRYFSHMVQSHWLISEP